MALLPRPSSPSLLSLSYSSVEELPEREVLKLRRFTSFLSLGRKVRAERRYYQDKWRIYWWIPDTFTLQIPVKDLTQCQSYHLEIASPLGTQIYVAVLYIVDSQTSRSWEIPDHDPSPDRAKFYYTSSAGGGSAEEFSGVASDVKHIQGFVRLVLQPTYHDGMRQGLNLSLLSLGVLVFLALEMTWPFGRYTNESVVALLLVAPAIVVAGMLKPQEHPLTKRVLSLYRTRVSTIAVILFVVAMCIAVGLHSAGMTIVLSLASVFVGYELVPTLISACHVWTRDEDEQAQSLRRPLMRLFRKLLIYLRVVQRVDDKRRIIGPERFHRYGEE